MFNHSDTLHVLNENLPLTEKLNQIHQTVRERWTFIDRIAVTIYDHKTDFLKTYLHSSGGDIPLVRYQSKLENAPSLKEIIQQRQPRVVNDLSVFSAGQKVHTQRISAQGYAASYTMPMYVNDIFFGFIFFNSYQKDVFNEESLYYFDLMGHLISLLVINEQTSMRTLLATVKTAHDMTHHRDTETGTHIDRMSRYARLIALHIAARYDLSDEFIENIFLFSPLHDIGKIAISDTILHKPGKLDEQERAIMQTHTRKGREIIDSMLRDHGLDSFENINILRNIAEYHHEAPNGSGYPHGLSGSEIPLEARIISVADVFDALTSKRPYKEAWPNDVAFAQLQRLAGEKLDRDCVEALMKNRKAVEEIQQEFAEDPIG
ncbi:MAG: HD domain-containing protein [Gammaproteobacteria bacterium]|nr:HD domain-containing protein [Gammaproteobacteria bacterium]